MHYTTGKYIILPATARSVVDGGRPIIYGYAQITATSTAKLNAVAATFVAVPRDHSVVRIAAPVIDQMLTALRDTSLFEVSGTIVFPTDRRDRVPVLTVATDGAATLVGFLYADGRPLDVDTPYLFRDADSEQPRTEPEPEPEPVDRKMLEWARDRYRKNVERAVEGAADDLDLIARRMRDGRLPYPSELAAIANQLNEAAQQARVLEMLREYAHIDG